MMCSKSVVSILVYGLVVLLAMQPNVGVCQSQADTVCGDEFYVLPADSVRTKGVGALPVFSYDNVKEYIFQTLSYPAEALEKGVEGTVYVGFDVETNGTVSGIHVVDSVHALLDAEALRLIQNMPRWKPFRLRRDTKLSYTVPIMFKIKEDEVEVLK